MQWLDLPRPVGQRAEVVVSCRHFADDAGPLTCLPSRGIDERTADRSQRDSGDHLPVNVRLPNEQLCNGLFVAVLGMRRIQTFLPTTRSLRWSRAALAGTGSDLLPRGSGEFMQAKRTRSPEVVV